MYIFFITLFTLIAFAANSILCRLALGGDLIDPVSFTTLRLISGALILFPISRLVREPQLKTGSKSHWVSGLALFMYAAAFSLAYVTLDAGTGALILFGAVQATMIGAGLLAGERPSIFQWLGLIAALGGIVYLVLPGITAPDPAGAGLMVTAGIAWGVYSVRGKGVAAPISSTTANFLRSVPPALVISGLAYTLIHIENRGVVLAVISGSITSGLGYVLWYRALRGITTTQAAIVQLLVPVIAAFGGVLFLSEVVSARLVIASVLILGGVAMAVLNRPSVKALVINLFSKN